ncbi:MAG: MBOAT family protein [Roseburia sp.]|nr:MBOAT family protein [Roseburia sp.]
MPEFTLLAPVGISFYIFKVVGYMIDVYRGKISAERNLGKYALFVSFFPQIVSGPIERSYNFLPQMEKGHYFNYDTVKNGFLIFLWGLLKKIVIADRLALLVDQVFNNVAEYNTPAYIIAMLFFAMQIYFDFAGYSDMAIGVAEMLGIATVKNFDRPYFAKSVGEFWRRWHMSLSTWFRDYLYIPLGGNRVSKTRWAMNTMIVFLASGLWHGSNWTFFVWGALHGIYQVIGKFTRKGKDKVLEIIRLKKESQFYGILATGITFVLVTYAWMFFRANTIHDALWITKSLIVWDFAGFDVWSLGMGKQDFIFSIVLIIGWFVIEAVQGKVYLRTWLQERCLPIRWGIYLLIMFTCIMFGIYGDLAASSFIYFQF